MSQINSLEQEIVSAIRESESEIIDLISNLVSHPSLLGYEKSGQDFMQDQFLQLDLEVDRFEIDNDTLSKVKGYSPPSVSGKIMRMSSENIDQKNRLANHSY